ncbi:heterokaryon incompatibility protein-domain-containing protein [Dendryphion nanum]|uniref:Heterokaryon incompatibility protein-domain-containing protein n=1 Tax=Dendryphion nanum TaxID=256645 RepID=A0A9P9CZD4_9PLEO|nr:heterokaryon incompatibility protein-domain-containing protein [Dendryphion nanum]
MADPDRARCYIASAAPELALKWVSECKDKHAICSKEVMVSAFTAPRRLIDIGCLGSRSPRLIESASLHGQVHKYIALSHCWGKPGMILKTIRSNILEHLEGIVWDALPKTFQDAIIVSQHLGVQYLWIDSLCIIQQDRADFEQECATMHLIYLNAHCMISASDSNNSSEGFLEFWSDFPNTSKNVHGTTTTPAFTPNSTQFRYNGAIEWYEWSDILEGPLNTRGWALQERQLAPRILHFTKHGLMWECRQRIGAGDSSSLQLRRLPTQKRRDHDTERFRVLDWNMDPSRHTSHRLIWIWLRMAEDYSKRMLTYQEDKLSALSGLAAAVASILPGRNDQLPLYLAGVWPHNQIRDQLFWCPFGSQPHDEIKQVELSRGQFSLPSWSWASWHSPVSFHLWADRLYKKRNRDEYSYKFERKERPASFKLHTYRKIKYLSSDISPEGHDLYGAIRGRGLKLRGYYQDLHGPQIGKTVKISQNLDVHFETHSKSKETIWVTFDSTHCSSQVLSFRFLRLFQTFERVMGIVVTPTGEGTFRRVGIFTVYNDDWAYSDCPGDSEDIDNPKSNLRLPYNVELGDMTLV